MPCARFDDRAPSRTLGFIVARVDATRSGSNAADGLPRIPRRRRGACAGRSSTFPANAERWSDATAWPGGLPGRGDAITVAAGRTLVIDQDIDIGSLTVHGTVIVAGRDAAIRAGWILVSGKGEFLAGTAEQPFRQALTITLRADSGAAPHRELGSKFLAAVNGGSIDLHGEARTSWVP